MSILFVTPCYGGNCTMPYLRSCVELEASLNSVGLDHDWLWTDKESLIQRARNTSAARFLETGYRKLMFIDADIEFRPEHVAALWNLQADVSVGLYPMKRKDLPLSAWVDGKLVQEMPSEPFDVDYAGTGFMMIDRSVFEKFREQWPKRTHEEGSIKDCFAWFHPRVHEDGWYMSEDYAFCHDFRELGGRIVADPSITLIHHGNYAYGAA